MGDDSSAAATGTMRQTKDLLTGRWTAIDDENVMSHTKVVLTFPMNHLNYANGTSDPVSLYVFDDMGNIVLSSIGLTLSMRSQHLYVHAGHALLQR